MAVQISGNDITVPRDGTFSRNVSIAGTLTYEDVTNVDSIGLVTARNGIEVGASPGVAARISEDGNMIVSGITTLGSDVKIGTGVTLSPDGNAFFTGVITATTFSGVDTDKISEGNTEAEVVDTGSDGHFKVTTEGTERIRVGPAGQIGIAGANYGTSGQVIQSQGSGSVVQWATPSNPTLSHAFCFMDSQYFTSSVTLLEFNTSTTNDRSSGVTIDRTNHRFTPTVAGLYQVQANLQFSHAGNSYTPTLYIYRNGSSYVVSYNIVSYGGGHYDSVFAQGMITMNGSSDYVDMRASHNGGGNATMRTESTFAMFRISA